MLNPLTRTALGVLFSMVTVFTQPAQAQPLGSAWAPGHVLVQPKAGISQASFNAVISQQGGKHIGKLRKLDIHIIEVPRYTEDAVVEALSNNPLINFAEKDFLLSFEEMTANDSYYADAWHLTNINAPAAWDHSLGDGIVVAILDTGVESSHPDLQGQILPGWNFHDNNADTADVHGHGTMVTGVVAALSNNSTGVTSIAWNAKILPVRISLPDGSAYTSTIANGLTWAADNGADVANISYAVSSSSSIKNAANYMRSKGGIVCVAAGNDGTQLTTSPQEAFITVSATKANDTLAGWSNYGDVIDLAAPGSGIWTTLKGGGYGAVSGTSFSSPATAAVIALVMAANPSLSSAEVETILKDNSEDLGTPGEDIYFGHGRIDAAASVAAALGGVTAAPAPDTENPAVSITDPTGGTVTGQITVSISASDNTGVSYVELYAGDTLISTDSAVPYGIVWDTTREANGQIQLTAYAYDQAGNQGISQIITVDIDNQVLTLDTEPPTITIISPSETTTTVSGKVKIAAAATDNVGVVKLEIYIDNTLKKVTSSDTLQYRWDTRKVADGLHGIMVIAYDAADNYSSSSIQVTVDNSDDETGGGTGGWGKGGKPK